MNEKEICAFNLLTCHEYDEKNGNIKGIFNGIKLPEGETLSFDLLTFINLINKTFEKLTVIYCIYNVAKGAGSAKVINRSVFKQKNGVMGFGGRNRKTSLKNLSSSIKSIHVQNMKFTEKGDYEIRAYAFWDDEYAEVASIDMEKIDVLDLINQLDNLVSVINIEIA